MKVFKRIYQVVALVSCGVVSASPWAVTPTEFQGRCYGVFYATASRLTFLNSNGDECNGVKYKRSSRTPTKRESDLFSSVESYDLQGQTSATCKYAGFDVMTKTKQPAVFVEGYLYKKSRANYLNGIEEPAFGCSGFVAETKVEEVRLLRYRSPKKSVGQATRKRIQP